MPYHDPCGKSTKTSFSISQVTSKQDLNDIIRLFEAYALSLGIDLAFQDFATEMARMPGKYSAPRGTLLLARNNDGEPLGCVGLRPMAANGICEMKRLYVDSKGRSLGMGKALAVAVISEAKRLGYTAMRLDTLPTMTSAIGLYKALGFVEIGAYYSSPIEGTIYLELSLLAK
jgi:ribosomal protein S18 acetylase RimI-like enzyme